VNADLEAIYEQLRARDPDDLLEAIFDLRRLLPEIAPEQRGEVASALSSIFFIDTNDRPDLAPAVEQAIKLVAALGTELISQHLEEMKGVDFKALFCFARVLSRIGPEAIQPVLAECEASDDPHLLVGAIYALSKIRHDSLIQILPLLLTHCTSPDPELRGTAMRALGKLVEHVSPHVFSASQSQEIFAALSAGTTDSKPDIRAKGVRGLGKMADRGLLTGQQTSAVKDRLEQILGRHDQYQWDVAFVVRSEAEEALENLRA
jgi:HEAT repeat protein